jgi:HamA
MSQRTSKQVLKPVRRPSNAAPDVARRTDQIKLGPHPSPPHPFGEAFRAKDGYTQSAILHHALSEQDEKMAIAVAAIREMLIRHHASPDMLERTRRQREAMERLGFGGALRRLPRRSQTNPTTRKGNLGEIVLVGYIVIAAGAELLVYRLRYNPNIEQSTKGGDVLAFDLDANPVRVIVGEAKFRSTSTPGVVRDLVDSLARSYRGTVPASLQFVAARLEESGQAA